MIPAGRAEFALDATGVAAKLRRKTLPADLAKTLPTPISRKSAKKRIWDGEQIDAQLAGVEVPALPDPATSTGIGDLLDEVEAHEYIRSLGAKESLVTWRSYVQHGTANVPEPDRIVCGVPHYFRQTLTNWQSNRPGAPVGAGRKKGSKDTRPRDHSADPRVKNRAKAEALISRYLEQRPAPTDVQIVARVMGHIGYSEGYVYRLLASVRDGKPVTQQKAKSPRTAGK